MLNPRVPMPATRFAATAIAAVIGLIAAADAGAQPPAATAPAPSSGTGGIDGAVRDPTGVGISDAQVSISGMLGRVATGPDGSFGLRGVLIGRQMLIARRIGFRADSIVVDVTPGGIAEASIALEPLPQQIAPVVVDGGRVRPTGRLRGFHERRQRGLGHFFTAEDIDRRDPRLVTDLLRTLPGVRVSEQGGESIVSFRGQRCLPLIWVDGAPATAGYLDPDVFMPSSLAGIEVYPGIATVPAELMWIRGKGSCGVIAVWTRVPEPRGKSAERKVTAQDLANMIASLRLYTASQVETPAVIDTTHPVAPVYPDSLLRSGVGGRVVVEFVVDTAGVPDMDTFGAVVSTDRLFTESVRRALGGARFIPAMLEGRRVRQLVQLPFTFSIPAKE
jgi:TonB family protein